MCRIKALWRLHCCALLFADTGRAGARLLFGLAIRHGLTTKDLKTTIFAYPTGASDIGYML